MAPDSPTTAAIAPNAPIGASHSTIDSTRNTIFCIVAIARSAGSAESPMRWMAKPTSSAMNSTCRTLPEVNAEKNVSGMMLLRKSMNPPDFSAVLTYLSADPCLTVSPWPGWMMLPTTRPIASANVDMVRK